MRGDTRKARCFRVPTPPCHPQSNDKMGRSQHVGAFKIGDFPGVPLTILKSEVHLLKSRACDLALQSQDRPAMTPFALVALTNQNAKWSPEGTYGRHTELLISRHVPLAQTSRPPKRGAKAFMCTLQEPSHAPVLDKRKATPDTQTERASEKTTAHACPGEKEEKHTHTQHGHAGKKDPRRRRDAFTANVC